MQKKYIDNYDAIKACIVRVIDDIYDMLDATEQAGISDSRTETLKKVVDRYEALLKKFKNKEDLSSFEEAELTIIVNQVISSMENQVIKLNKAIKELKKISQIFN